MTFKETCVTLRRQDYSLMEIARITGRPKTSIHYHIQGIPLTAHKLNLIRESYRRLAYKLSEKRRLANEKSYKRFTQWNAPLTLLVAHLLFDGEIHRGQCRYHSRSLVLIERIKNLVKRFCRTQPKLYKNRTTGVTSIAFYNASLGRYLKMKADELLLRINAMPKDLKREFLRAFFDDEGCIDYSVRRKHRRIRGYQKNVEILTIVKKLLDDFEIASHIQLPNEIVIVSKENLERFQNEIGFSPGLRVNGKRSNSIWKQSLEKREILHRAIASYKPIGSSGVHRS